MASRRSRADILRQLSSTTYCVCEKETVLKVQNRFFPRKCLRLCKQCKISSTCLRRIRSNEFQTRLGMQIELNEELWMRAQPKLCSDAQPRVYSRTSAEAAAVAALCPALTQQAPDSYTHQTWIRKSFMFACIFFIGWAASAQTIADLVNNGGPVMQPRTVFLIFWLPSGFH